MVLVVVDVEVIIAKVIARVLVKALVKGNVEVVLVAKEHVREAVNMVAEVVISINR